MPEIALINNEGQVVGSKAQAALAPDDVYHSIFVLLVTPERTLVASRLASGRLSATAVTVCRAKETADAAAARAARHASPVAPTLHHLGDQFYTRPDGRKSYMSVFYGIAAAYPDARGCELLNGTSLSAKRSRCTPALQFILDSYTHALPI